MKTKILIRGKTLLLILLLISGKTFAQTITPFVINFTGNSISNSNYNLDYSVGEVATTTIQNASNSLTQGFLQPDYSTGSGIQIINENDLQVYPNPISNNLFINYSGQGLIHYQIINVIGQNILSGNDRVVYLGNQPNGIYFLKIYNANTELLQTVKIIKQ